MINTLKVYEELQETFEAPAAHKIAKVIGMIYEDLQNTATKTDFNELKEVVQDLAQAQKRTEIKVEELAEAQKRTEIKVEELAEAQKRTEIKVEELAEAQKRTEVKIEQLAEAQKRTEQELHQLVLAHKETKQQLGGLATDFGYTLENSAYKSLPKLLKRDYGILLKGRLKREYVEDKSGEFIEVNIVGKARQNGKELFIAGESKSKLSRNDVNEFMRKKLKRMEGMHDHLFPIMVTHMTSGHEVEAYAKERGIALYYSYDF